MLFSICLPWLLRRPLLSLIFGYQLHPTSRIGLSWIMPKMLIMEANSRIDHLTICKGLSLLHLHEDSIIGNLNWITAYPEGDIKHYVHQPERKAQLILGRHSAITARHLLDCTDTISIGNFTILAGFQSQLITHSIDLIENRQSSKPIHIGDYSFVGSNSVLLGGAQLPDYCVLGANSLLNKSFTESYNLYAGVPARLVKDLPADFKYFHRQVGFVD